MSWTERMTIHQFQDLASRTIVGNRVRGRAQAVEPILALLIRLELAAQIELDLLGVLLLIQSVRRGLPNFNRSTNQWLLGFKVQNLTMHKHQFSIIGPRLHDILAEFAPRGIRAEERSQDSSRRRRILSLLRKRKCNLINQSA